MLFFIQKMVIVLYDELIGGIHRPMLLCNPKSPLPPKIRSWSSKFADNKVFPVLENDPNTYSFLSEFELFDRLLMC